jgi:phosphomannomutase
MRDYSRYAASGEINSTVADAAAATATVRAWADEHGADIDELDGLTARHAAADGQPMWWFNLRPSNTEPLLRLNVEAADPETMARVRDQVLAMVRGSGA